MMKCIVAFRAGVEDLVIVAETIEPKADGGWLRVFTRKGTDEAKLAAMAPEANVACVALTTAEPNEKASNNQVKCLVARPTGAPLKCNYIDEHDGGHSWAVSVGN